MELKVVGTGEERKRRVLKNADCGEEINFLGRRLADGDKRREGEVVMDG
jgi:hypothetical protein